MRGRPVNYQPRARSPATAESFDGTRHGQLEWIGGRAFTPDGAFAERERRETYERDRQEYERRLREADYQRYQEETQRQRARAQATRQIEQRIRRGVADALRSFDTGLRNVIGEENDLVYRFLQILIYVGIPLFLLFLLVVILL